MSSEMLSTNGRLGGLVRYPLRILPRSMTVRILRGELRGKKWIVGSQRNAFWLGLYEPYLQKLIATEVKRGGTFFDVGANVGFYTLLAASLLAPERVFAFEPVPENVHFLKRHLDLNKIKNVEVLEVAISDEVGMCSFRLEQTRAMGRLDSGGSFQVRATTLDHLLQQGLIAPPSYIKMDIEGAEYRALLGAKECLEKYRPKLFLATHGTQVHDECCRLLRTLEFEIVPLNTPSDDRSEIYAFPSFRATP